LIAAAFSSPVVRQQAFDRLLDSIELTDAFERLFCHRRPIGGVHLEELAPDVGPTGGLDDAVASEQLVKAGINCVS
jgi:hypothetical protein